MVDPAAVATGDKEGGRRQGGGSSVGLLERTKQSVWWGREEVAVVRRYVDVMAVARRWGICKDWGKCGSHWI